MPSNTGLPLSFPWHEHIEETRGLLKAPASAIRFALDHVDPGQMRDFMEDWQEDHEAGEDHRTRWWLEMIKESLLYGQQVEAAEAADANNSLLFENDQREVSPD